MAKKVAKKAVKKTAKKVVKKVLDSTELDEKLVAEYKENQTLYDTILCHIKCYGGYVFAVGAGCSFGVNFKLGLALFLVAAGWAYAVRRCKPCCKGGTCEPNDSNCCKQ
tara:strand:+ start:467 stop:793 length:327 start_codon:yes stop_codon:yes gene_type:complete